VTGPPPDQAARDRIVDALDATLFVEAGAGSGKTRALVDRVVRLVTSGAAELGAIAAITFTEKAAAELRDRVRQRLDGELAAARDAGDGERADRCRAALDDLDSAAIGTLHSFAQRILTQHPIEAGLPPRIEVLDEVGSAVAFDDRWATFLDQLLADPAVERSLLLATAAGVRPEHLRLIALAFNQNWDLARAHAPDEPVEVPQWTAQLDRLLAEVVSLCAQCVHCIDDGDLLLPELAELEAWARRVRAASDEYGRLGLMGDVPGRFGRGRKDSWPAIDLPGLRDACNDARARIKALRTDVAYQAVQRLAVDLRRFTLEAADERRRAGELEFHDLLVLARDTLRQPDRGPAVRAALRERYRHLLIDEFQDTDPIQIDLAVLIASDDPAPDAAWDAMGTREGHLFFVGDAKQSIYRFRRADISLFLRAAERFGGGDRRVALTTNFRTGASIIDLINTVFGELIRAEEAGGAPSQPAYEALVAVRHDAPDGPPVAVLGVEPHGDKPNAAEVRRRESADVAAAIQRVLAEGWLVADAHDGADPGWRPARAGDVTILLPTRTSLPALEDALSEAGISYRAESASLVYASRLVRDVLLTLRAIDDPTDELATVAALRSPLFACGDDDLFRFRRDHGGRFDYTHAPPETVPDGDPTAAGLAYLRGLHDERRWLSPSELADRVVRDRRVLELGEADGRPRDLWRRIRFVVDQARAWTDATDGTLRQYLAWIRQQTSEGSRVAEAVLPETDDDAVRILTVHAAKGLEFPVTILAGLSTQPQNRRAGAEVVWPPGQRCIIRIGQTVVSDEFEAHKPIDEQMSHDERIRLLYVACTRAQDHLIVSLHRKTRAAPPDGAARFTSAELLASALDDRLTDLPTIAAPSTPPAGTDVPDPAAEPAPAEPVPAAGADELVSFDEWRRQRDGALAAARVPGTVAATALTDDGRPDAADDPGLHKRPRDLDLPPWQKGRYGTAVGRAVHGVLQTIDLATGDGLADAVAAQAAAEGIIGHEPHITALVAAALAAPTVVEAAGLPRWREVYVGVPLGGDRTLEGYVDLLYRRPRGLVVVDYKTGPAGVDADLAPLVERYRLQGAAYALAVTEATGEPVDEVVFVFLTPEGAVERRLPDLDAAVADVRARAAAGDESLVAT
jgi:ATP-dependent exoDNAse (exonuclease V) beta subunit